MGPGSGGGPERLAAGPLLGPFFFVGILGGGVGRGRVEGDGHAAPSPRRGLRHGYLGEAGARGRMRGGRGGAERSAGPGERRRAWERRGRFSPGGGREGSGPSARRAGGGGSREGEAAPGSEPPQPWLLSPEQAPDSCSREPPPDTRAPPAPPAPGSWLPPPPPPRAPPPPRRPRFGVGRRGLP